MAIADFNKFKSINVASVGGTPTISKAQCFKIVGGDDSTTGTGDIVLDWTNISSKSDIGVYDENDNLLDYYFESFDTGNSTAVIWVYRAWEQDDSVQAKIAYGDGSSDQSVSASTVFDKDTDLFGGYLLNESSGDALDITSNNNDGDVNGATQGETGIVDGAYSFNGNDNVTASDIDISSPITFTAFIKTSSLVDNRQTILSATDPNDGISDVEYQFQVQDDGSKWTTLIVELNNGSWNSIKRDISGLGISNDEWIFVGGIIGSSEFKVYLGGEGITTDSGDTTISDYNEPLRIGYESRKGRHWNGTIDDVRIYNAELNETTFDALYAATKSSPDFFSQEAGESLVTLAVTTNAASNLGQNSATLNGTLDDLSGNANVDVYFEWGTDTNYGNTTSQVSKNSTGSFSDNISGLSKGTYYHYRAVVTDGTNTEYGSDVTFQTLGDGSATLEVDVSDPDGDAMDVSFYDDSDILIGTDSGVADGGTATITWNNLVYETTYSWYAIADDGTATTQSSTWSFTTELGLTAYTATLSESVNLSQVTTRKVDYSKSVLDTITLVGSKTLNVAYSITLKSVISITDALKASLAFRLPLTDLLKFTDSYDLKMGFVKRINESLNLNSIISLAYKASVKLKETLTLTGETIIGAIRYVQHLIDSITLTGTQTRAISYIKSIKDTITLTPSLIKKIGIKLSESITLTPIKVKISLGLSKIINELIILTDTMSRSTKFIKPLFDYVKVSGRIIKRGWTYMIKNTTNWTYKNKNTTKWTYKDKKKQ